MSAGSFGLAGYRASYNTANIHPIRIQSETLGLEITIGGTTVTNNGEDAAEINNPISAVVSRGNRALGLNARRITIKFTDSPPTGYLTNSPIAIAALNPALLSAPKGATGTYQGRVVQVVSTSPERVN